MRQSLPVGQSPLPKTGSAKPPQQTAWRSFEPIPYTKRALRAKIVADLIDPPGRLPIYAQPSLVSLAFHRPFLALEVDVPFFKEKQKR